MINDLMIRLRALLRRDRVEGELDGELQFHLDQQIEKHVLSGLSREEATRLARLEFGGMDQVKEECRDARGVQFMEMLLQDLRYSVRMLRRAPVFAAVAIMTLAFGIGANSALFSVVNGVLLNPLPYPHPEQLVTIHESKASFKSGSISYPNFLDWRLDNRTFSAMAVSRGSSFSMTGLGEAEQIGAQFITPDFFAILGVHPVEGRGLVDEDNRVGSAPVALISAGFRGRKFGSTQEVIGRSLTLDGRAYTIVGVIPSDFDMMLGNFRTSQIYIPIVQWTNNLLFNRGAGLGIHGIGRLKPGVSIDQARSDLARVTHSLEAAYPEFDRGIGAVLFPFKASMVGRVEPFLLMLFCAVGFVLLIVCANIANLMLVRSTARAREFAVRMALGAGKARIIRQVLTESILLAAVGGLLGLLLAYAGTRAALSALPSVLPRSQEIGIDFRVLGFTAAAALLAGALFGLLPALRVSRTDPQGSLRDGGRGSSGRLQRAHAFFVVGEVAVALVLLVGATLMLRSLVGLWNVDPGFNPRNVLTFGYSLAPSRFSESADATRAAIREIDSRLASTPGVQSVSPSIGAVPMGGDDEWLFWLEGQAKPPSENDMSSAIDYIVGPDYLRVMGIRLLRGRFITQGDDEHSPPVVVLDEAFARQYFPREDPIGRHIFLNILEKNQRAEIVGIVSHVKQWGLASDDENHLRAQLYFPFMQLPDAVMALAPSGMQMLARSSGSVSAVFDPIRHTIQGMDDHQVVFGAQTMEDVIASSIEGQRFSATLLGAFAALALLLSCLGVYGVISFLVSQRSQEIGIRMALGAQRGDVLRLIIGKGARMTLAGIGLGVVAALALTRLMSQMLFGVTATDPLTFGAVALLLALVALAACWVPALRAARVDPMVALRHE
jgi:predicted permease